MAAIKCSLHKDWKMKRKPTSDCDICKGIWELILIGAKVVAR